MTGPFLESTHSKLCIPHNVRIDYWERHSYSELDVLVTLKEQTPEVLAKLCVHYDIPIPPACIKLTSSASETFTWSSKIAILNKVCDHIRYKVKFAEKNVLQAHSLTPTHRLSRKFINSVKNNMIEGTLSRTNPNVYKSLNIYCDLIWVPIEFEEGCYTMIRVIPSEAVSRNHKMYWMRAFKVQVNGKLYLSTDEKMYVYCH